METIESTNRIDKLFEEKKDGILSIYFTAGYPELDDTVSIITSLEESGVDMIEVGIPFSDPVADGETIQKSSQVALANGMTLSLLFDQLHSLRDQVKVPIILMGYYNPVYQYGVEEFCKKCNEVGVDGLIIPDLPLYELESEYKALFDNYHLKNILLITPQTPDARIYQIDAVSSGFNYVVSSASTTGKNKDITKEQEQYLKRIQKMELNNPAIVGFGIKDKRSFENVCQYANGAIIGSAFIKAFDNYESIQKTINTFIKSIKA